MSQLDQGCVIPCPTAEDITKRGVPPMSPPLAMWEKEAQVVELEKGELGLGFSILDYQVRDFNHGKKNLTIFMKTNLNEEFFFCVRYVAFSFNFPLSK